MLSCEKCKINNQKWLTYHLIQTDPRGKIDLLSGLMVFLSSLSSNSTIVRQFLDNIEVLKAKTSRIYSVFVS